MREDSIKACQKAMDLVNNKGLTYKQASEKAGVSDATLKKYRDSMGGEAGEAEVVYHNPQPKKTARKTKRSKSGIVALMGSPEEIAQVLRGM